MDMVISDLFFNHEHPKWDAAVKSDKQGNIAGDPDVAIRQDATEFVSLYGRCLNETVDPEALAVDFLDRV